MNKSIKENRNITGFIRDTKVFEVLSHFNPHQLNRLKKFVQSPYFNKNEQLTRMMEYLDEMIRHKEKGEFVTKGALWDFSVGAKQEYDDARFRKMCSDLLRLIEGFIIQEEFEQNQLQMADNLLTAVYNRKLEPLYNSTLRTAHRMADQYYFRPSKYFFYKSSLERGYYYLSGLELARSKQLNVEEIAGNLDKFYVAEKLRAYIMMTDRQRMVAHDYHIPFIDEIATFIETGNLRDEVPINMYYQIYLTRQSPDNVDFFMELKRQMEKCLPMLPQLEAFEILDSALNYCIGKINTGDTQFLREYIDLSVVGINNEVLLVDGQLSPWIFRNIVVSGLRLRDFEWVQHFIADYQGRIDQQFRQNAVSFNLANLYFYQRRYSDVLELLRTVEYEDPSYNLNSKIMLMLTFYELNELDSLASILVSFETYLRRKKEIPADRKLHYNNLIKFVKALMRISPNDDSALKKLQDKIRETKGVVNKDWLLEKIDELLD